MQSRTFSADEHYTKYQANLVFVSTLQAAAKSQHLDWQVSSIFYAALHLVQTYFAVRHPELDPQSHVERNRLIATTEIVEDIYPPYRKLYERSREARYQCTNWDTQRVTAARKQLERIERALLPYVTRQEPPSDDS